jgi:hypothetical protein
MISSGATELAITVTMSHIRYIYFKPHPNSYDHASTTSLGALCRSVLWLVYVAKFLMKKRIRQTNSFGEFVRIRFQLSGEFVRIRFFTLAPHTWPGLGCPPAIHPATSLRAALSPGPIAMVTIKIETFQHHGDATEPWPCLCRLPGH